MPVTDEAMPEAQGFGLALRSIALAVAGAVAGAFVLGVTAPLAGAAPEHSMHAMQPVVPLELPRCGSSPSAVAPEPEPAESPMPSVLPAPSAPPTPSPTPSASPPASPSASAKPKPLALRINSGGGAVTDGGVRWIADRYFVGGSTSRSDATITSPTPKVDADERWGLSGYLIPVPRSGTYRVRIHLTELTQSGAGQRVMNIEIEGNRVATNVDVGGTVGLNRTRILEFTVNVDDRQLNINTAAAPGAGHPTPSVTGIEVLSTS